MSRARAKNKNVLKDAMQHWKYVSPLLTFPKNEAEYNFLVSCLDKLLDKVGEDETHSLMNLVDILSQLISTYEEKYIKLHHTKGIHALKYLMESQQLTQADLSEIGSQGVVSEILNERRKLNLRQIKLLAKKFKVSPATFMDE